MSEDRLTGPALLNIHKEVDVDTENVSTRFVKDPLSDPTTLPELSFDDLLDESPIKRFPTRTQTDDVIEPNLSLKDQTLNTPGPKRKIQQQTSSSKTDVQSGEISTEIATTSKILTTPTLKPLLKTTTLSTVATTSKTAIAAAAPIVLNNKLSLNQSGGNVPQTIVKITTAPAAKVFATNAIATSTGTATSGTATTVKPSHTLGTMTTIGGKTAIKTASGQIVYLQKAPIVAAGNSVSGAAVGGVTTSTYRLAIGSNTSSANKSPIIIGKPNVEGASTSNVGVVNKTVAIQYVRSADGKLVQLKTPVTTTAKNTLPLSPGVTAQIAVKKLLPTNNQVVIKTSATTTTGGTIVKTVPTVTNVAATTATLVNPTAKPFKIQKIMAPSASALSKNSATQILNAPPIPKPISPAASSTSTLNSTATTVSVASNVNSTIPKPLIQASSTASAGQKVFVQGTNGKQIIVPNSQLIKLSPKQNATISGNNNATATGINSKVRTIQIPGKWGMQYVRVVPSSSSNSPNSTISESSTVAAAKLLNTAPTKFSVVRPNSGGKFILTNSPKIDGSGNSPGTTGVLSPSKVQKTLVTVPTLRTLTNQESLAATVGDGSPKKSTKPLTVTLLRPKGKISEINTEIKRMTTANIAGGNLDLAKKQIVSGPDGKRYFVMPRTLQQQQQSQQQQLQKLPSQTPKAIVKAGPSEGSMKSFIICKQNQSDNNIATLKSLPVKKSQFEQSQQQLLSPSIQTQQNKSFLDNKNLSTIDITSNLKSSTINSNNNSNNSSSDTFNNSNTNNSKFIPIKIKEELLDSDEMNSLAFSDDPFVRGGVRRKHCNCSKSQCLKLYCDCFANGEFCQDCTCKDCFNSLQYEDERLRAIRSCLDRNPSAFKPKITSAADQGDARLHNKGCNCKRSGCLKNYCECFEAKIPCSSNCKCVGCRNIEDRPDLDMDPIDPKILETIANASNATNTIARAVSHQSSGGGGSFSVFGAKRNYEQQNESDTDSKRRRSNDGGETLLPSSQLSDEDEDTEVGDVKQTEKRNTNFITQEVIDATIQCMISQADECLKNNLPTHQIEKLVIEELGRCLVEIIDFSIRNTDNSFTQN